jgi:glycosyltransferase involved in cell wall biosynthesis
MREKPATTSTSLHVLTLTPFYPSDRNDVAGCFVAEPLRAMESLEIASSVYAVRSIYHANVNASPDYPALWKRYASLPGGLGLSSAGAFLFSRLFSQVQRVHLRNPIHLIHAHAALPCGHAAMLLSRQLGVPFVVTVHGLDAYSTNQVKGHPGEWCRRISRSVFRSAVQVICVSKSVQQKILEQANREYATSVVYNGADPELFKPAEEPHALKVLSVGNLIPVKGHESLLRAIALTQSRIPDVCCEIIGEGPELQRLQAIAQQWKISEKVKFSLRCSRSAVADAMRNCTVFALPSRYEALGCVYLEAMSAAKPVIACRGQGIAEVIEQGRNGWLVEPDDPAELSHALVTLFEDVELRSRMRLAARRTILKSLTIEHQARRLSSLYRECAA